VPLNLGAVRLHDDVVDEWQPVSRLRTQKLILGPFDVDLQDVDTVECAGAQDVEGQDLYQFAIIRPRCTRPLPADVSMTGFEVSSIRNDIHDEARLDVNVEPAIFLANQVGKNRLDIIPAGANGERIVELRKLDRSC
jgi:hypothetical protein